MEDRITVINGDQNRPDHKRKLQRPPHHRRLHRKPQPFIHKTFLGVLSALCGGAEIKTPASPRRAAVQRNKSKASSKPAYFYFLSSIVLSFPQPQPALSFI